MRIFFGEALGLHLEPLLLGLEGGAHLELGVLDALSHGGLFLGLLLLDIVVDLLDQLGGQPAQLGRDALGGLLTRGDQDLTGLFEDDRVLGRGGAERLERSLCGLL